MCFVSSFQLGKIGERFSRLGIEPPWRRSRLIARAAGLAPPWRRSRPIARAAGLALLALSASNGKAAEISPHASLENHACAVVLGLNPSEADYGACVQSLDLTLSKISEAQAFAVARDVCTRQGLDPNGVGFADCINQTKQSLAAADDEAP